MGTKEDLLKRLAEEAAAQPETGEDIGDAEALSPEEKGVLKACLAWSPEGKPLEQDEAVLPFLKQAPENLRVVQAIQRSLARNRKSVAPSDDPTGRHR
jgi:hypothetical protein